MRFWGSLHPEKYGEKARTNDTQTTSKGDPKTKY